MKAMWMAFAAIALITVGAYYTLQNVGWSQAERSMTTSNVRLD